MLTRNSEAVQYGAIHFAKKKGYDGVFCGHTHMAMLTRVENIVYGNDGTWQSDDPHFIGIKENRVDLGKYLNNSVTIAQSIQLLILSVPPQCSMNSPSNSAQINLDSFVEEVRSLLERQRMVEGLVSKQAGPKQEVLEMLTYRQHLAEMQNRLASRHPADIAFVLESLPMEDRVGSGIKYGNYVVAQFYLNSATTYAKAFLSHFQKMNWLRF